MSLQRTQKAAPLSSALTERLPMSALGRGCMKTLRWIYVRLQKMQLNTGFVGTKSTNGCDEASAATSTVELSHSLGRSLPVTSFKLA